MSAETKTTQTPVETGGEAIRQDESVDLEAIKARAEAATPGPWDWTTPPRAELQNPDGVPIVRTATIGWADPPDAEFIARAREDIPLLVQALEDAHRRIAELEAGQ